MIAVARSLLNNRDLLAQWASRTLQARYQQSMLGWLWAVVQPGAQAAMFTVIFTRVVPIEMGETPYVAFSYVATVAWAFLAAALTDMTGSLVENMALVKKIYFPREILPLASATARLADFAVGAALFVILALWFRIPALSPNLLFVPVVLAIQVLLVVGIGLATAALNVFVRDVRSIMVLAVQLWFYASPVLYPVDRVPERLRGIYDLNPMVGVLESYRAVLLRGEAPDGRLMAMAAALSVVAFVGGYAVFKATEPRFADIV